MKTLRKTPGKSDATASRLRALASGLSDEEIAALLAETRAQIDASKTTETELDDLLIQRASMRIAESPAYSKLAAALLIGKARAEARTLGIDSFSKGIRYAHTQALISAETLAFVERNHAVLDAALDSRRDGRLEFLGAKTLYDRYLLKDPRTRATIECPQALFLRVACGLSRTLAEALELYGLLSSLDYLPSTPTLFNSGTRRAQMSSCYLVDSPADDLESIYRAYGSIALLSKYAGGVGLAFHRIRSRGSLIRGTNGLSNGVVPWLKTLDASVAAVNQGGRRKGACCVYLETWHADIEEFLELKNGTGDDARRAHNLHIANWVPDLFMRRVEADADWSLFSPDDFPRLCEVFGEEFDREYAAAEQSGKQVRRLRARELYGRMMKTLAQTGNGWMCFKDAANRKCNQAGTVHLSNLCTEILEVTDAGNTAVCNLGSINLARHVDEQGAFDFDKLSRTVRLAVKYLDRVIDLNFYPLPEAARSNSAWRPVGLGVMGLQDLFFELKLPFDSPEAASLSTRIQEQVYFEALGASCDAARVAGAFPAYSQTKTARGLLQFDLWGVEPSVRHDWPGLRARIAQFGLRNSLLIAIAPTATISGIAGCGESIEPQLSNLYKRETLSGEFVQVNRHLARDLRALGLWNETMVDRIKRANGSIQGIPEIPADLRLLYRTVWELPMRQLIDLAAARAPFVDQSQSLNLFMERPTLEKVSSMYFYAWKKGLKTTYYLRSRPSTEITQTTSVPSAVPAKTGRADSAGNEADDCEVCQ